jgi:hypothetical protein
VRLTTSFPLRRKNSVDGEDAGEELKSNSTSSSSNTSSSTSDFFGGCGDRGEGCCGGGSDETLSPLLEIAYSIPRRRPSEPLPPAASPAFAPIPPLRPSPAHELTCRGCASSLLSLGTLSSPREITPQLSFFDAFVTNSNSPRGVFVLPWDTNLTFG